MQALIELEQGINAKKEKETLVVTGPLGENKKKFLYPGVSFQVADGKISISSKKDSKNLKKIVNTWVSHMKNLIQGTKQMFVYKLVVRFSHFPISVKVEEKKVVISNFIGERRARKSKIIGDSKVEVQGEQITVSGINKEDVAQTAAGIENSTKISSRDRRIFQDGIYLVQKDKKVIK